MNLENIRKATNFAKVILGHVTECFIKHYNGCIERTNFPWRFVEETMEQIIKFWMIQLCNFFVLQLFEFGYYRLPELWVKTEQLTTEFPRTFPDDSAMSYLALCRTGEMRYLELLVDLVPASSMPRSRFWGTHEASVFQVMVKGLKQLSCCCHSTEIDREEASKRQLRETSWKSVGKEIEITTPDIKIIIEFTLFENIRDSVFQVIRAELFNFSQQIEKYWIISNIELNMFLSSELTHYSSWLHKTGPYEILRGKIMCEIIPWRTIIIGYKIVKWTEESVQYLLFVTFYPKIVLH